jgi:hypothetical protein
MAELRNPLGLVILVAGVAVGLFAGRDVVEARKTESWTEMQGTVLSSEVVYNPGGVNNSPESWSPEVTYEYEVGGRVYTSGRVRIGGLSYSGRGTADRMIDGLPKMGPVTLFYDPGDPEKAVLVQGTDSGDKTIGLLIAGGLIFLGIMAYLGKVPIKFENKPKYYG